jgi:hypothetical protein
MSHIEDGRLILSEADRRERRDFIDGLRALANFYEDRPDLDAPLEQTIQLCALDKQTFLAYRRAAGFEKYHHEGEYLKFEHAFSPMVKFQIFTDREHICERVQVGEIVIPARDETLLPAKPEERIPKYEWRCPDSILANK